MYSRSPLSNLVFALVTATILVIAQRHVLGANGDATAAKVDFSYAFATPHRITVGRPSASDRTLLDLQPGSLRMAWTYDNLTLPNYPLLTFKTPPTAWEVRITPQIDGKPLARSRWTRLEAVLPALENVYEDAAGSVAIGGYRGHDRGAGPR